MIDIVDETSEESFPASDPPSWTLGVRTPPALNRSADPDVLEQGKVLTLGNKKVVHIGNGRGEELRQHLASHGIDAEVSPAAQSPFERLEIEGDVNAEVLQAILDEWER